MQAHQQTHITTTCRTALKYLVDVRLILTTGMTADGTRYAPFPEPVRAALLADIERLIADLEAVQQAVVPEDEHPDRSNGVGAARMWITTLLLLAQEQLDDIRPERMGRQYGALPDEDAAVLRTGIEQLHAAIDRTLARWPCSPDTR